MILCIDSGNTRLKWALHDGERWLRHGALPQAETFRLMELLPAGIQPQQVMIANVAGPIVAGLIDTSLAPWRQLIHHVEASVQAGGVSNAYANPRQLGVDRWCALIGARARIKAACLVVGCGTATTIDTLDANGRFLGGFILPGNDLMRSSLARNTAQLPLASGDWQAYPDNTDNAIVSGCLEAQLGAIERAYSRIAENPGASCLLFGGNAPQLSTLLACPHQTLDKLVLEGLRLLAA